ncbi:DsbA family protein [Alkalimarinus alittae]|uniref:DsbA family protein n=1 Tax=Alkalimarinus alittae TaxID=2961619 RepID=A0ABY6MXN8_9ALTE|nr:DsbA family protein [Alkalimarinus alittae]UZE94595.1 DsbA family protein [Alkalimarinus alittae]
MKSIIMPHLARIISSDALLNFKRAVSELKRFSSGQPHVLDVFLHINDPYSYLLLQVLPDLEKRYQVTLRLRAILRTNDDMFPEQEMLSDYAFKDARILAQLYELSFPSEPPLKDINKTILYTNQLIIAESSSNVLRNFNAIFDNYWHSRDTHFNYDNTSDDTVHNNLARNETRLKKLGHYMAGMIHYAGEWYWGIDRLEHLERRANKLGLSTLAKPSIYYNRTHVNACNTFPLATTNATVHPSPLTLFFSIRSPYSHLGLERAVRLAKYYDIALIVKPVLPMVMRGLAVPDAKKMYIFHDTKREANKYGINYGFVADPLGAGVERCYALFDYAESEGKGVEYLLAYARAVNAQGIRSETDKGLKKIVTSCGLDWNTAKSLLAGDSWRLWAEQNLKDMYNLGLWGVPSFQHKNTAVWGQDRIFVIENQIIKDMS